MSKSSAMQNLLRKGKGTCAYCGREKKLTKDHVFPQSLFIVLDKSMFTVPSCHQCQRTKELGDRDLEIYVMLDILGSSHPDTMDHIKRIMGRNEATRNWLHKLVNDADEVPLVTDDRIQLSTGLSHPYNADRILTMMRMVSRALFYETRERVLGAAVHSHAERIPWNIGAEVLKSIGAYRMGEPLVKGNMVVWWGEMPIESLSEDDGLFIVCFNDAVVFLLSTGNWADSMEAAEESRWTSVAEREQSNLSEANEIVLPRNIDGTYIIPTSLETP